MKKGSYLEQDVLVAHGSSIGENSTLFKAVVGKSTKVGKDVALRDCIIGSNVAIGDGCHLSGCVIGDNVVIGSKANISHRYIYFRYSEKRIMGGKVCLRCKSKTLLGIVNKLLKTKSLLTSPSNVFPDYPN